MMGVTHDVRHAQPRSLLDTLNEGRHETALRVFTVIVLAHWGEHLLQAFQIYGLGWPVPEALGLIGYFLPWVVQSETLHYVYAIVMLVGFWALRPGFTGGADRTWWTVALWIQFFHHVEHLVLLAQWWTGVYLDGRPVPTSLVQLWVPRVELHLFSNTIGFVPMVFAMFYHMFPQRSSAASQRCTCQWDHGVPAGE
jgi:hypothetical protein